MQDKCKKIRNELLAYFDNELPEKGRPEIEKHINECKSCQEQFRQFKEIRDALKTGSVPEHNQEYWENLKSKIINNYQSSTSLKREHNNLFQLLFSKPAFWAACLLVLFGIIFLFKNKENSGNSLVAYYPGEKKSTTPKLKSISYAKELGNLIIMQPKGSDTLVIWFAKD